jgi:hypothetical protein
MPVEDAGIARQALAKLLASNKQWKELPTQPRSWLMTQASASALPVSPVVTVGERFLITAGSPAQLRSILARMSPNPDAPREIPKVATAPSELTVASGVVWGGRLVERALPTLRASLAAAQAMEGRQALSVLDLRKLPPASVFTEPLGRTQVDWMVQGDESELRVTGDLPLLQLAVGVALGVGIIPLPSVDDLSAPFWSDWERPTISPGQ